MLYTCFSMSGMQNKCSKQAAAERKLYTYAHAAEKKYSYAHERVKSYGVKTKQPSQTLGGVADFVIPMLIITVGTPGYLHTH